MQIFRLATARMKINQTPYQTKFFQITREFSLNIASSFSFMMHNSSVFFSSNIMYFGLKKAH